MSVFNLLKLKEKFEIQTYSRPRDVDKHNHVPFSGSPKKHPHAQNRIILITDPFTYNTIYYEFRVDDIAFAEELPNITNIEGDSVPMARLWIKRQCMAIQCTPFIVDTLPRH